MLTPDYILWDVPETQFLMGWPGLYSMVGCCLGVLDVEQVAHAQGGTQILVAWWVNHTARMYMGICSRKTGLG